jgi:hypothetical protein
VGNTLHPTCGVAHGDARGAMRRVFAEVRVAETWQTTADAKAKNKVE